MVYYKYFLRSILIGISNAMIYRFAFLLELVFTVIVSITEIMLIEIYYSFTFDIEGWDKTSFQVLFGVFNLIYFIDRFLFSSNIQNLPINILLGKMDQFILYPLNSLYTILLSRVELRSIPLLIVGNYFIGKIQGDISFWAILQASYFIGTGVLVCLNLQILSALMCFYFENMKNIPAISTAVINTGSKPYTIYNIFFQVLFTLICPLVFATNFASISLQGEETAFYNYFIIFPPMAFLCMESYLWKIALRRYFSAN